MYGVFDCPRFDCTVSGLVHSTKLQHFCQLVLTGRQIHDLKPEGAGLLSQVKASVFPVSSHTKKNTSPNAIADQLPQAQD